MMFMRMGPIAPHIWAGKPEGLPDGPGYCTRLRETCQWFYQHEEAIKFGPQVLEPRPDDALYRVDFTSTGCTLIHRSVLEAMKDPWFVKDVGELKDQGEDRYFFENARAAGFDGYVDRSCIAGHMRTDVSTGVVDFMVWMTAMDPDGKDPLVIRTNLGEGAYSVETISPKSYVLTPNNLGGEG
jgi:hypothetical protein